MQELVKNLIEKGFLLDAELLNLIKKINHKEKKYFLTLISSLNPKGIVSKDFIFKNLNKIDIILKNFLLKCDPEERNSIENLISLFREQKQIQKENEKQIEEIREQETYHKKKNKIKIISKPLIEDKKFGVKDFVSYFKDRFKTLKAILQSRTELNNLISINKISNQRQNVSIIGMVYDKRKTKNKNILLEIEDLTGRILVLVNHNKKEVYEKAETIVLDEVIGISGSGSSEIFFANDIIFPEIINENNKHSKEEEYALFTADLHIGSKKFLREKFEKFIKWLNLKTGSKKQKEIASKVKYLFIAGDVIDGIGNYPTQQEELEIKDIKEQFREFSNLISKIRKDINIIIIPGNHDAIRIAEPQPPFDPELVPDLYKMENVFLLTNPAFVNIGSTENFSGYNVLLYHGFSLDFYYNNIDFLRLNKAMERPELLMHFLLKKRHLAPTHTSTQYIPYKRDYMIINPVPDIFFIAHIHRSAISKQKGVLCISSSCWQEKTSYQEKFGHKPDFCKVPCFNLKTKEMSILDFN